MRISACVLYRADAVFLDAVVALRVNRRGGAFAYARGFNWAIVCFVRDLGDDGGVVVTIKASGLWFHLSRLFFVRMRAFQCEFLR